MARNARPLARSRPPSIRPPARAPALAARTEAQRPLGGLEGRLSGGIYEHIFERIVAGEFPGNARLPSETELALRLGASRPVVREALARLREDGVIVSRQGSGSYVRRRPDLAILRFVPVGSIADVQLDPLRAGGPR